MIQFMDMSLGIFNTESVLSYKIVFANVKFILRYQNGSNYNRFFSLTIICISLISLFF